MAEQKEFGFLIEISIDPEYFIAFSSLETSLLRAGSRYSMIRSG
jgi:hypothetical protein